MPKPKHLVWKYFECMNKKENTGKWAKCRECSKEMQGIPSRMEKHILRHQKNKSSDTMPLHYVPKDDQPSTSSQSVNRLGNYGCICHSLIPNKKPCYQKSMVSDKIIICSSTSTNCPQPTKKQHVLTLAKNADVIATTEAYGKELNLQIGRYFYATNTPFLHADHVEFKKMMNSLRPGYNGPSSHQIGGPILNEVYEDVLSECRIKLQGETVCMSMDGWSNIHNELLICCSIITQKEESFLVDTSETGAQSHNAENLKTVALEAINKTENQFNVKVRSFVKDNTGNVQKMRSELEKQIGIIQYGCSAHILNLLAKDLEIPSATSNIFRQ